MTDNESQNEAVPQLCHRVLYTTPHQPMTLDGIKQGEGTKSQFRVVGINFIHGFLCVLPTTNCSASYHEPEMDFFVSGGFSNCIGEVSRA